MPQIISTNTKTPELTTLVDEVNSNLTYLGIGKLGIANSDAKWQIRRIQKVGAVTSIQYADGNRRFDNVWDDRASLTYTN